MVAFDMPGPGAFAFPIFGGGGPLPFGGGGGPALPFAFGPILGGGGPGADPGLAGDGVAEGLELGDGDLSTFGEALAADSAGAFDGTA